jgi:hypothetical protein
MRSGPGDGKPELRDLVASELSRPASEAVRKVADAIRRRQGEAVAAVVFYGSCLRGRTHEGVLDFYALVDSYDEAYRSRVLAWTNALLPPNVFYIEIGSGLETLRAKYAVVSSRDFERMTAPKALRTGIWARFCQPAALVYARDEAARQTLVRAAAASVVTALWHGLPLLPAEGGELRFRFEELWQTILRETYAAEMRAEAAETIRGVYLAAPDRFDRAARCGLDALAERGWLRWRREGDRAVVTLPAARRRRAARAWALRKPLRKAIYMVGLLKSAATFGDWLPYVLWKLERHTGTHIELSDRQRSHPLIWGWPVFWRVLRKRILR